MKVSKSIFQFISNNAIWILIIIYTYIRSQYWDCQPIWDGMWHYSSLLNAIQSPFDILNYCNDNHISQGFMLVMALPYLLYKESYYMFNIWVTLFDIICIVGFYKLLLYFFKNRMGRIEIALMAALFAFHPSVLGSMTHFTIDIGVLTFFILYWLMLLYERRVAATIFGVLLLFSKETAILLVPLPFLFCLLLKPSSVQMQWIKDLSKHLYKRSNEASEVLVPLPILLSSVFNGHSEQIQWVKKYFLTLFIPYFLLVIFILYKVIIRDHSAMWNNLSFQAVILDYFGSDGKFANYLAMIFIINFNWILTLLCLVLMVMLIVKWKSLNDLFQKKLSKLFIFLFLAALIVLTVVVSWSNVRYVILMTPLMILMIAQLSSVLIHSKNVRISVMILLLLLFGFEDVRTIDPVSRLFFGTFDFGEHKMLCMAKRTGEYYGGNGRDQVIYNLEYFKFRQILNTIFIDIKPTPKTCFLFTPGTDWWLIYPLDSNYKMTYQKENTFMPKMATMDAYLNLSNLPNEAYVIDMPNFDNKSMIETLNKHYSSIVPKIYDVDGYQIDLIHYENKTQFKN